MRQRRRSALGVALFCLFIVISLSTGSAQPTTPGLEEVNFGLNAPGAANWIYYIAQRQGFFRDEGLRVQTITSGTPTNTINLLASGEVQLALNGTDLLIESIAHHLPIKIIAPELIPNPYVLLAQPSISSWAQLKGKSVLLGPKGDTSSITFTLLVRAQHFDVNEFSIVPGSTSSARYAGLISGHVGATVLSQPFSILATQKGMRVIAVAADIVKDWLDTCFAVNTTWAATHRSIVVRMMRALRKAAAYGYSHPDAAMAALVAEIHVSPQVASVVYDQDFRQRHAFDPHLNMNTKGLSFMVQLVLQERLIETVPPVTELFDPSFVAEAAQGA